MRLQMIIALLVAFGLGVLAGRGIGLTASAQDKTTADPYAEMLHVGVVVKDLDQAVARWKAMGFSDIRVLPPNKGVDRTYHGKPIDVALKQAFVHGTRPMVELMEPVGDSPSPWGDYLKEHGEALHHVAFRIPDTGPELEKYRGLGLEAIASGKWPEGQTRLGDVPLRPGPEGGRYRRVHLAHPPAVAMRFERRDRLWDCLRPGPDRAGHTCGPGQCTMVLPAPVGYLVFDGIRHRDDVYLHRPVDLSRVTRAF